MSNLTDKLTDECRYNCTPLKDGVDIQLDAGKELLKLVLDDMREYQKKKQHWTVWEFLDAYEKDRMK